MLVNPIITGFSRSIGSSELIAGLVAGIMNLTSLVLRPVAGNLTDHHSKYALSSLGGIFLVIASIGYLFSVNSFLLLLFRIINGIGYVLCTSCMATWMASLLPREKTGSGMGIYGLTNALGVAIAPALGIYLYHQVSYQAVFIVAAVFGVLMTRLVQFVGDHGKPVKPKQNDAAPRMKIIQPKVLPIALILMLFALPYFATQTYIVSYVSAQHLAVSTESLFPIYAVILLILRIALRNLFDTVSFGKFLYIGLLCALVGLLALTHLTNNLIMVVAALGFAGGFGLMFSVCQSAALLIVHDNERGLANSTFYVGIDLGMALGPIVGGAIRSLFPLTYFYPVILVTLPLIWVIYFVNRKSLDHIN
ncbi:MFS transporter [Lactobacillus sp. DCY120]|uniref:MFS transporter n=2 Tax=Bombilactobacillus apium TaxID=2675299 RepID=A0A850R4Y4_9LACO|nr:MFS transporter [Bombilactobacillus apium]